MSKTRKVQVTLDEEQYGRLQEVAEREGTSLAAVAREAIVRHCVEPAERRRRRQALLSLTGLRARVPDEYRDWEREYSRAKAGSGVDGEPAGGDE